MEQWHLYEMGGEMSGIQVFPDPKKTCPITYFSSVLHILLKSQQPPTPLEKTKTLA